VTCKNNIQRGNNPFFNINEARTFFTPTTTENPWYATLYAGLDVMYGNSYGRSFTSTLYKDAYWCHDKSPTSTYGIYWGTTDHTTIRQYTYNDRPTSGDGKAYFDTIEHHLNVAVLAMGGAMGTSKLISLPVPF